MTRKFTLAATLAAALTATGAAADGHGKTIVDIAAGDDRFETLVAAVTAADLGETLSSEGPFTVFAPTDEAFAALPEGTVDTLLMEENKGDLTNVLLYHVVPGKVMAGDIPSGKMGADTALEDGTICIAKNDGVMLDDGTGDMANVVIADIEASNGVIHVIDKVVLPGNSPDC